MKTDNRVLYFSLNQKSVESFYKCLDNTSLDCQCSFRAIEREQVFDDKGKLLKFRHASDLLYFLNDFGNNGDLGYLYVIIDYPSFFNLDKHCSFVEFEKTNELESFSVKDAAKAIRRAILQYPEVFFMFDESWNNKEEDLSFLSFLFYFNAENYINNVWAEYHKYNVQKGETPFDAILRGRSNLFDCSNLRYAIKRYEYDILKVERYNFSLAQDSRMKNLAICVEEERSQNRFNSYVLFTNGYRVLPVFSSKELKDVNKNATVLSPKLIVRDYDLQFPDVDDKEVPIDSQSFNKLSSKESYTIHTIDYIRGAKYINKDDNTWVKNHPGEIEPNDDELKYLKKWLVPPYNDEHSYWGKLLSVKDVKVIFVSKGVGDRMRFFTSTAELKRRRKCELRKYDMPETDSVDSFVDGIGRQSMRGTTKPVSGIYTTFRQFETIKDCYDSFCIVNKRHFLNNHPCDTGKAQKWYIDTNRQNHEHGVPLDIYDTVRNMLDRALKYYNAGKYIRSAIISSEVIEVLNGFHEALVLQAYHILAISENALAMNTIGGNEEELSLDANFRISKIASEVDRLMDREKENCDRFRFSFLNTIYNECIVFIKESGNRRKFKYNVLNQIYSECRSFCKEKQHFEAEDRFISAMAHVNEGYTYKDILLDLKDIALKWASVIRQFIYTTRSC